MTDTGNASSNHMTNGSQPNAFTRLYLYSGRPIPDYTTVKTPEAKQAADLQLKEAKAAVDIQR